MGNTNIRPVFISAPLIRIKADGKTVAHAIGLTLNVNVDVQPVYTFGEYGPINVEPLQYGIVTGTMQITKLARRAATTTTGPKATTTLDKEALSKAIKDKTFGEGEKKGEGKMITVAEGNSNSPLSDSELAKHMDPNRVGFSRTFDLDVKINHSSDTTLGKSMDYSLLVVQNCRLSGVNINISMGSLVNEPISFQGLLLIDSEKEVKESADYFGTDG